MKHLVYVIMVLGLIVGCELTTKTQSTQSETLIIDLSKRLPTNPYQTEYAKMLYPTVRIKALFSTGSGVVIDDYIITAAHVVGNQSEVKVEIFYPDFSEFSASVVITDTSKDLALLRALCGSVEKTYSAQLASQDYKPYIFAPVWAVGCSLGLPPRPSFGHLCALCVLCGENGYWEVSAPILPGNSGGPVFDANTYEVIGIAVWVQTYQGQLITTMAGVVPINEIYEFLKEYTD